MQIALFKGKSLFPSMLIEWFTRSPYSHAGLLCDEGAVRAATAVGFKNILWGSVIEAWEGGVKVSTNAAERHTPGTPVDVFEFFPALTYEDEKAILRAAIPFIGRPYSYFDILAFVLRIRGEPAKRVFCSQLVVAVMKIAGRPLFNRTESWEVPPGWIPKSLALRFSHSMVTTHGNPVRL